jgi:hypothetical protein
VAGWLSGTDEGKAEYRSICRSTGSAETSLDPIGESRQPAECIDPGVRGRSRILRTARRARLSFGRCEPFRLRRLNTLAQLSIGRSATKRRFET